MAFLRDITERKEADKKIKQHTENLEKADKQKNEFLAILGHELRNPLAAISGSIEVLKVQPAKIDTILGVMGKSLRLISSLLDDMLDLTRMSRGEIKLYKKAIDLRGSIEDAVANVKKSISEKNQLLKINMLDKPIIINADATRIEQVIINILSNARNYTSEGGMIELTTKINNKHVIVSIKDNGIGIDPKMLEEIFYPFTRSTKELGSPGSLGIGLALVKQLITLHDGKVSAKSNGVGEGAEIIIELTLANSPDILDDKRDIKYIDENVLVGLKIMLVDDNPEALEGLAIVLNKKGSIIRKALDAKEALNVLQTFKPDMFILDIGMPGMNGYELCDHLRKMGYNKSLIVAVSGYGHEDSHLLSQKAGMDYHMNKPLDYYELIQKIAFHYSC